MVEKVLRRLNEWKANLLSFIGRVLLTQLVLVVIPTYVMQGVMLPGGTFEAIDKVCRNFVWGSKEGERKLHTVSWSKVTRPKKEGGLGLTAAKPKNLALLRAKLNWMMQKEKD